MNLTDTLVRNDLRMSLSQDGVTEAAGQSIKVNGNVYDPNGSGAYVRPDLYLRDEGVIFDGTIGSPKPLSATQMQAYIGHANPNYIIEVAPGRAPRVIYMKPPGCN